MNKLPTEKRAQILGMMVKGMPIRAIARMTGASKNTIAKLLVDAGEAFSAYQDKALRNLPCKRLQLDEIRSFVCTKEKNASADKKAVGKAGDIWTWTAIDTDTKLIVSWLVGARDGEAATRFVCDLADRLANGVQITMDGHRAYLEAVEAGLGADVDYAISIKLCGQPVEGQKRYSPLHIIETQAHCCPGNPDPKCVSTSYVGRPNLSMRMGMRPATRLTNTFSKKIENYAHAIAIYFMNYNFARIHQTLRVTPAIAARVTDKLWSLTDMVHVVDEWEVAKRSN